MLLESIEGEKWSRDKEREGRIRARKGCGKGILSNLA